MAFNIIFAQDDFFEPGHTIGGYGELHWNQEMNNDGDKTKNMLDFHRFIIFFGYNYSEKWSLKSELEIEHNMIEEDVFGYISTFGRFGYFWMFRILRICLD